MKIMHCSDIHLDSAMRANLPEEKAKERREELLSSFCAAVEYAKQNGASAVIIAGDLFDTAGASRKTIRYVEDLVCSYKDMDFFLITGNHDKETKIFEDNDIPNNLKLFKKPGQWTTYDYGGLTISGIEHYGLRGTSFYDGLVLRPNDVNIAVMHGEASRYKKPETSGIVYIPLLKDKHIDYLALGHFHNYLTEPLDKRGTLCYSGCLEGRGFDESGVKGFVMLDIDEKSKKVSANFVPFCKRRYYEAEADITGFTGMFALEKAIIEKLGGIDTSSLVKLVLKGRYEPSLHKDVQALAAALNARFYFCKIQDESVLDIDRGAYKFDVSLKGEFIRLVTARTDLNEKEKADIIDCGLGALESV